LFKLKANQAQTSGTVISVIPESHGSVVVRYQVNARNYEQTFAPYNWRPGAHVRVYYYPPGPAISAISDPAEILSDSLPAVILASLFASTFFTVYVFVIRRPDMSTTRLGAWIFAPRVTAVLVLAGVLCGILVPFFAGHPNGKSLASDALALGGTLIFLHLAWTSGKGWAGLLRSSRFWIAVALALVASLWGVLFPGI